ncbi:hypothetical protein ACLKA6_019018 [Drosophila palustris]
MDETDLMNTDANSTTVRHSLGEQLHPATSPSKHRGCLSCSYPSLTGLNGLAKLLLIFSTVVENDAELTKVEKLQHLLSSLEGVALEAIRSLEPTEKN